MGKQKLSYELVGAVVAKDIFSNSGVCLISSGAKLLARDIELLMEHKVTEIEVIDHISPSITNQILEIHELKQLGDQYLSTLRSIKQLFEDVEKGAQPHVDQFVKHYQDLEHLYSKYGYFFLRLNKIKGHDEYTYRHSVNVSIIASLIAKLLRLPADRCELIGVMGLLHDIGKMRIPREILLKPGPLTNEEFEVMKTHTIYGYEMLKNALGYDELIAYGALYHHEKLDGSGYPKGICGEEIPLEIQILTVADIYDALCSDRIYKEKQSSYQAVLELMDATYSGKLNAQIVLPFVYFLLEGFVGGTATLHTGEQAEIMLVHQDEPHRPLLRIGERYVDLRKERNLQIVEVMAK